MRTLALASRGWVSGVWFFLEMSGDAGLNPSVGKPGPYWHHTAWWWWREGEVVNRNIPPRIKNLLFGGQSQQTLPLCASACFSSVFSFVLSSSPCLLGLSVSLISHCFFFPPSPSPTVIFSPLSVSHPTPPSDLSLCVTQGFLFPFPPPSPWFTCSPAAPLAGCFIGGVPWLVGAVKAWSFHLFKVSRRHFNDYWLDFTNLLPLPTPVCLYYTHTHTHTPQHDEPCQSVGGGCSSVLFQFPVSWSCWQRLVGRLPFLEGPDASC